MVNILYSTIKTCIQLFLSCRYQGWNVCLLNQSRENSSKGISEEIFFQNNRIRNFLSLGLHIKIKEQSLETIIRDNQVPIPVFWDIPLQFLIFASLKRVKALSQLWKIPIYSYVIQTDHRLVKLTGFCPPKEKHSCSFSRSTQLGCNKCRGKQFILDARHTQVPVFLSLSPFRQKTSAQKTQCHPEPVWINQLYTG